MSKEAVNKNNKNTIVKDALILCVITLIAGFLLGFVYEMTADKRQKAAKDAKDKAYALIFGEDVTYEAASDFDDKIKDSKNYFKSKNFSSGDVSYDFTGIEANELVRVKKDDEVKGYIITLTTPNGYAGNIQIALGVDITGTVSGLEILSIDETPGLGMNAKGEFKEQFKDKNVDGFVHTKSGKQADNEIDAITSATITTKAVTGAVDAGLSFVKEVVLSNETGGEDIE